MKVLILGSGVIGVTSAYYLARAGHEVTVVDRQPKPALETSFANAGEVSPGYSSPWAGPGVPVKAIKWLLMKHGPLVIRPKLDPVMWLWLLKMLRNCTAERYAVNKRRMIPIAEYSRDCLRALRSETGIRYDERARGTLQLFRYAAQLDHTADDIAVLKQYGVPFEVLDRAGCVAAEPALADVADKIAGGLRLPQDETGDCHMFTQALALEAEKLGVRFAFNVGIEGLNADATRITGVATSTGVLQADAYVVALGSWSSRLVRPLGISLPGLSRQGLLDHRADIGSGCGAGIDGDGRKLQGRDHAARRSHPRRRHRRSVRLFDQTLSGAARDARSLADRPVSARRRSRQRPPSGAGCGR